MKKRILILCLIFILAFSGCNTPGATQSEESSDLLTDGIDATAAESTDTTAVELTEAETEATARILYTTESGYVVYCSNFESIGASKVSGKYAADYSEIKFAGDKQYSEIITDPEKQQNKYDIEFNGKTIQATYGSGSYLKNTDSPLVKYYNNDSFKDDNGCRYLVRTSDNVVIRLDTPRKSYEDKINSELASDIVSSFTSSQIGDDVMKNYVNTKQLLWNAYRGEYEVFYTRYLFGMATSEQFMLGVRENGDIGTYWTFDFSIYDGYEELYDEDTINDAVVELRCAASDFVHHANISDAYIKMSESGNLVIGCSAVDILSNGVGGTFYIEIPPKAQ